MDGYGKATNPRLRVLDQHFDKTGIVELKEAFDRRCIRELAHLTENSHVTMLPVWYSGQDDFCLSMHMKIDPLRLAQHDVHNRREILNSVLSSLGHYVATKHISVCATTYNDNQIHFLLPLRYKISAETLSGLERLDAELGNKTNRHGMGDQNWTSKESDKALRIRGEVSRLLDSDSGCQQLMSALGAFQAMLRDIRNERVAAR